jgi:GNAT superfamily N-acetyltransferase
VELTVSAMTTADCEAVAALSGQLGYPSTGEDVGRRFERIAALPDHQILVARLGQRAVGWIHFFRHVSLATDPRVEILGLVVNESIRGKGVGSRLIADAEAWGKAQGLGRVQFGSRITRPDAHRLYLRLGYEINKTSHIFQKTI